MKFEHNVTETPFSAASFLEPSSDTSLVPTSNGIDLKKLASDTRKALKALQPFYDNGSKWWVFLTSLFCLEVKLILPFTRYIFHGKNSQIASKVKAYAKAIDSSIEASEHGHTIATAAIDALNHVLNTPGDKLDPQDKVVKAYLQNTLDLASKGCQLAEKARDDFQDVRKNLKKASFALASKNASVWNVSESILF